jgi:VWFA-related protein
VNALLWLALGGLLLAQAPQTPIFRSRVDLVTVDVSVLDREGRPIEGLGPDDFHLEVDGNARRVVSAQYVPYRTSTGDAALMDPAQIGTAGVTSNEHTATGRVILIAVDQANIRRAEGQAALRAAAAFVDALAPSDRVAAVGVQDSAPIDFTADHATVKRSLRALTGRAASLSLNLNLGLSEALAISDGNRTRLDQAVVRICGERIGQIESPQRLAETSGMRDPCPVQIEQQSRALAQHSRTQTTHTLNALGRLIARMAEIEGPKTLVLLSETLVAEPQLVNFTDLAALAQKARVTIYTLQLDVPLAEAADDAVSPTWNEDLRLRADGLGRLAGAAGGAVFPLIGAGDGPFRRILTELSGYYLLALEPSASDRDGRPHRIHVSVRREQTVVRARAAFQLSPVPAGPVTTEQRLVQLLRTPRTLTELPIRLATYNARGDSPGQVRTIVGIEAGANARDVTFGFVIVDDRGLVATSATYRSLTGRYSFPAALEPGSYLLRAAAVDAVGRTGTLEQTLDVRLHGSAPARTSDLVLAERADGSGQLRPIVERTSAGTVEASLEIYTERDWTPGADGITIELTAGRDSAPLLTLPATLRWSAAGHWIARAEIDLARLPPGRYVAEAIVGSACPTCSAAAERVSRPFVVVR